MKHKKRALFQSIISLILCCSMLAGTTFAWFTDSVSSTGNIIKSGNLKIGMEWTADLENPDWQDASQEAIFDYSDWEPGYTDLKYLKITNKGNLAFQYQLTIEEGAAPVNGITADGGEPAESQENLLGGGEVAAIDEAGGIAGGEGGNISNAGNSGNITPGTTVSDAMKLAEVIDVYYANVTNKVPSREDAMKLTKVGTLADLINDRLAAAEGILLADGSETGANASANINTGSTTACIMLKMREEAGNAYMGLSPQNGYCVKVVATQYAHEKDSFGSDYDTGAVKEHLKDFSNSIGSISGTASVETDDNGLTTAEVSIGGEEGGATIPTGVQVEEGTTELTLAVTRKNTSEANITSGDNEELIPLDVHITGVSATNTTPIRVNLGKILPEGMNIGNVTLYHVENGATNPMTQVFTLEELDAHNEFYYDPATGNVTVAMATFSEVALVADTVNAWKGTVATAFAGGDGTEDNPYIIANADQFVYFGDLISNDNEKYGDKHYKLIADINFGGEENANEGILFYPIGYHKEGGTIATLAFDEAPESFYIIEEDTQAPGSTVSEEGATKWYTYGGSFKGTFDGAGHTVSNIYQNTWQLKGNYSGNYWNAAMGLFGYVNGGTVKNLTVDNFSSDGEFTPTGVIAAYAVNSIFENIAITNCNPRVYNTGNGGIVGIGGNSDDPDAYKLTFTNITIDNTNKISALWGSWDVACGGLVGMFRGAGHVYMTNCHVAAQIDVYNDVCGNYQYYWYRYSGMMVGTNKKMITDANGYTVPETDKFHAENCTVHFGEWNDYYYCELVANSLASYTHDHQFSRLEQISSLDEIKSGDTWTKAGNFLLISGDTKTCYHIVNKNGTLTQHLHTDSDKETVNGETVLKEDKTIVYLPFNQLFTGYGWGVKHIPVYNGDDYAFKGITILDREVADSVEKFDSKFTGDFLYRVGNKNTVSVGSLFAAKAGTTINNSGVYVTIDKVDENTNVSGTFTANTSDWTTGTIQFSGTGVVKVTIQDYDYCTPTVLYLEVVDAVNATGATSATKNNVVLLNDCGFSSLEVSGGYTLYGNGFTMTCGSDSYATDRTYAFVDLKGGTLDNVIIVAPNFSHAIMYEKNKTENSNPSYTDSNGKTRYYNIRSAVIVTGTSKIVNSYISGGRAAIYATAGTLTVENSTIYGGAVANIQAEASNNLVLENVTLIQKPIKANVNDTSKTVMGLSVVMMCDTTGNGAPVTLKGYLHQYAWANEEYSQYVPSDAKDVVGEVLNMEEFVHSVTYDDGATRDSVNLGFAYMPDGLTATNADNMKDDRLDKASIPYAITKVKTVASIYTYKNTNGTDDAVKNEPSYEANVQGNVLPTVNYQDTNDSRIFTTSYDAVNALWKGTLKVDVDAGEYTFSFDNLLVQKYGKNLAYTVQTEDGTVIDKNVTIPLNSAVSNVYKLVITDDQVYDQSGNKTDKTATVEYIFELLATKTSLPAPTWESKTLNGTPYIVVDSKGGDWNCAVPVLDGLKVKYWSKKQNKEIELDMANVVIAAGLNAGLQNGSNNTITITVADEYTLTITTAGFKTNDNGKPVVLNNKLYFTVSSSSNYVSTSTTSRTPNISYEFTDANNSDPITLSTSFNVVYATYKSNQYKYSDFCNGKLTAASTSCVTPDTLVTLADGTQKRIDALVGNELLLVWDFYKGEYSVAPVGAIVNHGYSQVNEVTMYFADGSTIKTIGGHGFYDVSENKFVILDEKNIAAYIGHEFVTDSNSSKSELVDYSVEATYNEAWTIVSAVHFNCVLNGLLTLSPTNFENSPAYLMPFEIGEDMKYDGAKMQADIEKYGQYTYEEFQDYCTYEQFVGFAFANWKVAVGKGYINFEDIIYLINTYVNN